jgi:uncharacterized membrane-anchored protein YhcB (DUF1043 family)
LRFEFIVRHMTANLPEQMVLQAELDGLQPAIDETREYYTVHLLESLDCTTKQLNVESRKLSNLTRWLIGLTAV